MESTTDSTEDLGGRSQSQNIISLRPGTTRFAQARDDDIQDAFSLFFPQSIGNIILKYSNAYAQAKFGENYRLKFVESIYWCTGFWLVFIG